jgi:hypothetical protein
VRLTLLLGSPPLGLSYEPPTRNWRLARSVVYLLPLRLFLLPFLRVRARLKRVSDAPIFRFSERVRWLQRRELVSRSLRVNRRTYVVDTKFL